MFKFVKIVLYGLLLLNAASCTLHAQSVDENLHINGSKVKEEKLPQDMQQSVSLALEKANDPETLKANGQLNLIPMPLLVEEQEAVVKSVKESRLEIASLNVKENKTVSTEVAGEIAEIPLHILEEADTPPSPLNESVNATPSLNRTGRQLFYSPNFFYIQNIGGEGSKCITSRGLLGICMGFNKCSQQQQRGKRQLAFYSLTQLPYFTHYVPQQEELCSFYDQYTRTSPGVCCTGINNVTPIQPGVQPIQPQQPEMPEDTEEQQPPIESDENDEMNPMGDIIPPKDIESLEEDSEVLEPPANFNNLQPEPPKYDNNELQEGNNIGYDPVDENLKQAQLFNNYIRYPWPAQFIGFSGVQQWPPPLPTHPPSVDSWPPPIPTHPPNHHYPTHPPSSQGQFTTTTKRSIVAVTTRKPPSYPTYPNYPTYRPVTTSTTTTTTKRPFVPTAEVGGVSPAVLPMQCGTRNVGSPDQERIVGGTNASPHEFPWIAVLFKSGKQFCGGSLITNSHVLTAAHCVARMTSWDVAALTIHLGDYNIRTDFEVQHVSRRVKRLVRHKGFDFSILHNDVAVLTLSEPVKFNQEIQPICLPTSATQQTRSYSGHVATVAGWGSLRENGPQPSILQKVQIPIWTNSECAQKYGRAAPGGIIESMVCAGQAAKDSCSGDSGGPLIVNEGGRYVQVGIVSWGIGCGKGQYPGVYTRVTSLLPWIYKNIK